MREALREVTNETLGRRIVFLSQQPDVVRERQQSVEHDLRFFVPAGHRVSIREPEAARDEDAFAGRQAVFGFLGVIAHDEAVAQQALLYRAYRAEHARIVGRQKTELRNLQQARVERARAIRLDEAIAFSVVAALADFSVDPVANLPPVFELAIQPI